MDMSCRHIPCIAAFEHIACIPVEDATLTAIVVSDLGTAVLSQGGKVYTWGLWTAGLRNSATKVQIGSNVAMVSEPRGAMVMLPEADGTLRFGWVLNKIPSGGAKSYNVAIEKSGKGRNVRDDMCWVVGAPDSIGTVVKVFGDYAAILPDKYAMYGSCAGFESNAVLQFLEIYPLAELCHVANSRVLAPAN